jgi:glucokinase
MSLVEDSTTAAMRAGTAMTPGGPAMRGGRAPGGTAIGIDIGGTNIDIALADHRGSILKQVRLDTRAGRGPEQALRRLAGAVRELSRESAISYGIPVSGHAAVCPGVVQDDRILLTPNLPGWETLALARRLAQQLEIDRIDVWNDVRAGAMAELRFGALRNASPGLYVSLGTGLGAALTVDGKVLDGAHRAAGEIGYLVPAGGARAHDAEGAAPLEKLIGGKALAQRASAVLGQVTDASGLFSSPRPAARRLVRETLELLSIAVANLAVFADPEVIVIGGGMMASADVILPALAERLKKVVPFPPDLAPARFEENASLHGAIAIALDASARKAAPCS